MSRLRAPLRTRKPHTTHWTVRDLIGLSSAPHLEDRNGVGLESTWVSAEVRVGCALEETCSLLLP